MSGLEIVGLEASYGRTRVLHDINLVVQPGSVVVALGANGAGKTTMLRAVTGGTTNSGRVTFDGHNITHAERATIARLGVAHVPQGRGTFTAMSVEENLRLGGYRSPETSADDMSRCFELWPILKARRNQQAGNLSGGEQQMLAVARALMARPSLMLLDEPSLGLAPLIVRDLFHSLTELKEESATSMLIVEQNANLALKMADYAYVLEAGHVVHHAPAESVADDDKLRRAYLGM